MSKPVRLRLSRAKGFDLQALSHSVNGLPAVNVARPSKWGNPYRLGQLGEIAVRSEEIQAERLSDSMVALSVGGRHGIPVSTFDRPLTASDVVSRYRAMLADRGLIGSALSELRGKNLACWCKPGDPCHADVLLELANRPVCEEAS